MPKVSNVNVQNVISDKSKYAIWIKAFKNSPARDISLKNCTFKNVKEENVLENVQNLTAESVTINGKQFKAND